jgi:PglZ domain
VHPLHDYLARQLSEKLRTRKVVVWYDSRRDFAPFVDELRGASAPGAAAVPVTVSGISAQLAQFDGSFFELRAQVEPYVSGDEPEYLVLYLPGVERDHRNSVLMELEKAGIVPEWRLKAMARHALRHRYTDGVIDELLAPEWVGYSELAQASADTSTTEPPSLLKAVFHDVAGNDAMLAAWLASDARDQEIEAKDASGELAKLARSRIGIELPADAALPRLRSITLRYVLAGEFRSDLRCPPPAALDAVPAPPSRDYEAAVRELAKRLRATFPDAYPEIADRVEAELGLAAAPVQAEALGSIDTFRFEERALLAHCGDLIAAQKFREALALIEARKQSFWLDRDLGRSARWEACRRMANLGQAATDVLGELRAADGGVSTWVNAYTAPDGWHRMDQAQRRLESWMASLEDDPDERPLGVVRRVYEDACHAMTQGFTRRLADGAWGTGASTLHQTRVYADVVAAAPKPVAYFLVDALRYEMGLELFDRLPKDAEVSVRPAVGALPGITRVGMAALQPGASASFSVVERGGRLGALIGDAFLPDLAARARFATARVPNLVDLSLDELLSLPPTRLAKRVESAQVVVVRSQEIDSAGEAGFTFQARQVMDTVIDNIARAIRKLTAAGVQHAVVTADHGHLFFPSDRDESMRTNSPGGDQVELHRRCWIGRGGTTPPGCVRVSASALGYVSDLEFVFPAGSGVFRAGGDLAYHHGGPSLQELIVPVLTVRLRASGSATSSAGPITAAGLPDAVTNRIFSVTLQFGGPNLSLFAGAPVVRPLLVSSGREVGTVGMVIGGELDRATGTVALQPNQPVSVAFLLHDESVASLRVVVQDPATDAELYRSPADIPVRLGV